MDKTLNEFTNISTLKASDEVLEANDNNDDFEVHIEDLKKQLGCTLFADGVHEVSYLPSNSYEKASFWTFSC